MKYADYGFRIDARAAFYVEAKAANQSLDKPEHVFQAKRYAWSSMRAEVAVLTDFEEFRVFDARRPPDIGAPEAGELKAFRLRHDEYAGEFRAHLEHLLETGHRRRVARAAAGRDRPQAQPGSRRPLPGRKAGRAQSLPRPRRPAEESGPFRGRPERRRPPRSQPAPLRAHPRGPRHRAYRTAAGRRRPVAERWPNGSPFRVPRQGVRQSRAALPQRPVRCRCRRRAGAA